MTNPSPPSSPFEQVVEAMIVAHDETERVRGKPLTPEERAVPMLQAALSTGLLKLVEERPEEWAPESEVLSTPVVIEAIKEGVREYETWKQSLEQPSSKPAPRTSKDLEQQDVEQPRAELLDGAEAHELYSMFLAHVCSSEFHPRHPLITGAKKLAAMLDENHARFNEVLPDDDDPLAEQPRGGPSTRYEWHDRDEDVLGSLEHYPNHPHIVAVLRLDAPDRGKVGIYLDRDQAADAAKWLAAIDNPSREGPRCTCERGADLDHWSRCDVHRVERSYTAPLIPSDTEGEDG